MRNHIASNGFLAVCFLALTSLPANAQTATYAFVADESGGSVHRFSTDGTTATETVSNGYPVTVAGAEQIISSGRWLIVANHKGTESITAYDIYNGGTAKTLVTFAANTGAAGMTLDAATGTLYVAQENLNGGQISRYSLANLAQQTDINQLSATFQNTVTLASAHDVLFHNGALYASAGSSSFKGVKQYSANLGTVTDFISQTAAASAGYGGTASARTTGMAFSPDGTTLFLASADLSSNAATGNFVGRFTSTGTFLGNNRKINNPTTGGTQNDVWGTFGLEFFNEDLYLTPYNAPTSCVTKVNFNSGANYGTDTPTLSVLVGNPSGLPGAKYVHFATVNIPEPTAGAFLLSGILAGSVFWRRRSRRSAGI